MDLLDYTEEELFFRMVDWLNFEKDEKNYKLVFGTICSDLNGNHVEVFKKIETPNDLDFLRQIKLRARFNPHRGYRYFYFKTDNFEKLENNLNKNPFNFSDWILNTQSIKIEKLL